MKLSRQAPPGPLCHYVSLQLTRNPNSLVKSTISYSSRIFNPQNSISVQRAAPSRRRTQATRRTQARLARVQNTMDLELSSRRNSLGSLSGHDHDRPPLARAKDRDYVPPDGGYGWVCVACVFLVNAHTWGLNFVSCLFHCLWSSCAKVLFSSAFGAG